MGISPDVVAGAAEVSGAAEVAGAADEGAADGEGVGSVFGAQPYRRDAAMTKTRVITTTILNFFKLFSSLLFFICDEYLSIC
jgi:hypothetical protein